MSKKLTKEALAPYQQILSNKLAEKNRIRIEATEEIERLERELEDVKVQIRGAISTGDNEGFKELADQRSFCELRIKYLQEQINKLPEKPASESEGNDFARGVIKTAREIEAVNTERAHELITELQALMSEAFDMRTMVNSMLASWCSNMGDIGVGKAYDGHWYISDLANLNGQIAKEPSYKNILYKNNSAQ